MCLLIFLIKTIGYAGADPGFQVRGGGGGGTLAKMFGVFCVKNHDFRPKNLIFFPILGWGGCTAPGYVYIAIA